MKPHSIRAHVLQQYGLVLGESVREELAEVARLGLKRAREQAADPTHPLNAGLTPVVAHKPSPEAIASAVGGAARLTAAARYTSAIATAAPPKPRSTAEIVEAAKRFSVDDIALTKQESKRCAHLGIDPKFYRIELLKSRTRNVPLTATQKAMAVASGVDPTLVRAVLTDVEIARNHGR